MSSNRRGFLRGLAVLPLVAIPAKIAESLPAVAGQEKLGADITSMSLTFSEPVANSIQARLWSERMLAEFTAQSGITDIMRG